MLRVELSGVFFWRGVVIEMSSERALPGPRRGLWWLSR